LSYVERAVLNSMKAPPPNKPPPESKTTNLVEKLDSPLICRAFFIGVSYLARAIACESALARGDIEAPPEEGLEILPTYSALCAGYIEALRAVAALKSEQQELLKKFNQSVNN
jgi:hypothetical protein